MAWETNKLNKAVEAFQKMISNLVDGILGIPGSASGAGGGIVSKATGMASTAASVGGGAVGTVAGVANSVQERSAGLAARVFDTIGKFGKKHPIIFSLFAAAGLFEGVKGFIDKRSLKNDLAEAAQTNQQLSDQIAADRARNRAACVAMSQELGGGNPSHSTPNYWAKVTGKDGRLAVDPTPRLPDPVALATADAATATGTTTRS